MKILLLSLLVLLSGCNDAATTDTTTTSNGIKIEKLFVIDGCTMYRYDAYRSVYFTTCKGTTTTSHKEGKNTITDSVTTNGG